LPIVIVLLFTLYIVLLSSFYYYITATSVIYTLSLHDALPISAIIILILVLICIYAIKSYTKKLAHGCCGAGGDEEKKIYVKDKKDRKSTRLNSSHVSISYAVFCLKKKINKYKKVEHT